MSLTGSSPLDSPRNFSPSGPAHFSFASSRRLASLLFSHGSHMQWHKDSAKKSREMVDRVIFTYITHTLMETLQGTHTCEVKLHATALALSSAAPSECACAWQRCDSWPRWMRWGARILPKCVSLVTYAEEVSDSWTAGGSLRGERNKRRQSLIG